MSKKVIIILVAIIVLLVAGGIFGFMWLTKSDEPVMYTYDPGDFFVTNVMDSKSLIKADVLLEVSNKKTNKYLTENQFKVRDSIIRVLRTKTHEEIMAVDVQEVIEKELIDMLSSQYGLEGIENVYFNEFVVQQ